MKAKVSRGSGARGAANYILDAGPQRTGDKHPEIVGGTCSGTTAEEIGREIGAMKNLRPDAKRHVWHCSLALPAGERLTDEQWHQVARAHLENMGFNPDGGPWVAVRHRDTPHDHIHILKSRIDLDGSIWHGKWEARKAIESTQELEKQFGLTITPGLDELDSQGQKKPKSKEVQMQARTGEPLPRIELQEIVDTALSDGEPLSVFAFIERIEAAGAKAIPNVASTGRMNGFAFELNGIKFKASDLGKTYSWKELQKRGVIYEQATEGPRLIEAARRIAEAVNSVPEREPAAGVGTDRAGGKNSPAPRDNIERIGQPNGGQPVAPEPIGQSRDEVSEGRGRENVKGTPGLSDQARQVEPVRRDGGSPTDYGSLADHLEALDRHYSERDSAWSTAAGHVADLAAPLDRGAVAVQPGSTDLSSLKPDYRAKIEAWRTQHEALMAPHYRITLMPRKSKKASPYNLGKRQGGEVFFTASQVEGMIPRLRGYNARGYDIYITPIDPNHHYLLIDDMTQQKLDQLRGSDLKPALVQKSSTNNFQAVVKIPKVERSDEQSLANGLVGRLNKRLGDPRLSGAIHPFRMAGFSNQKAGRRKAFTKIEEAIHRVCDFAAGLMNRLRQTADQERKQAAEQVAEHDRQMRLQWIEHQGDHTGGDVTAEYRRSYRKFVGLANAKGWQLDGSALDYRVCGDLLRRGFDPDDVKAALLEASPAVAERHHDPEGYADRTVDKAATEIQRLERIEAERRAQEAKRPKRDRNDNGPEYTPGH